jgi:class 3 adenylate cyclase
MRSAQPPENDDRRFDELEAQVMAHRWRLFSLVTALIITLTEPAALLLPNQFPPGLLQTMAMDAVLFGMYFLARIAPPRPVIGAASCITAIFGSAYVAGACAERGGFASPDTLAMAVVIALMPGILALSATESVVTLAGSLGVWIAVNFFYPGAPSPDLDAMFTNLIYLIFLSVVTFITVVRNRKLRYAEFRTRREIERLHKFTVEEVLYRHLPAPYVQQVLSGARTVDQPAERRLITVVFADIVGFTALCERLAPDELGGVLTGFYDLISTAALEQGATLDKFIGDAAMAFFGAPASMHTDEQARRAVAMACEWHRGIAQLYAGPTPLSLRIGIHQDWVTVGSFGGRARIDYTAFGRGVNIAARLENRCAPGRILVTNEVRRALNAEYPATALGETELRGVALPVSIFEIDPVMI